ncbi:peroxidase 12 [Spinacia oleracea]|uniref:Peroxidase n=1 Tax=Spinacia oleracea TaxID=3562 RepID=A0ABM3QJP2_SPIOL|nr:peroxidase 12-like [Spinacia oleracea]
MYKTSKIQKKNMAFFKVIQHFIVIPSFMVGVSMGTSSRVPVVPGLSYTFYSSTCPGLDFIIRGHLIKVLFSDRTQAAGLLRLHFHDCFVKGCDGSVLMDGSASDPSDKDALPNLTLRSQAFKIINDLRACYGSPCASTLWPSCSCANIITLAARDSVFLIGGPFYLIPLGRRDGLNFATQGETLANLPPPFFNTEQLLSSFATKNLNTTDLVALSGAHTIGIGQCTSFTDRLYPTQDPTMDQTFANNLKRICPTATTNATTNLDIRTPNIFDNKYYVDLVNRQGLFTSDQDLYTDSRTRGIVTSFATNQGLFFEKFIDAMVKMSQLDVLTGSQGEIRSNCSVRNANSNMDLKYLVEVDEEQGKLSQF